MKLSFFSEGRTELGRFRPGVGPADRIFFSGDYEYHYEWNDLERKKIVSKIGIFEG